jgi:hypothetical protein
VKTSTAMKTKVSYGEQVLKDLNVVGNVAPSFRKNVARAVNTLVQASDGPDMLLEVIETMRRIEGISHRLCLLENNFMEQELDKRIDELNATGSFGTLEFVATVARVKAWEVIKEQFELENPGYKLSMFRGRIVVNLAESSV